MSSSLLICVTLLTVSSPERTSGRGLGNFPLNNCITNDMDILALFEFYSGKIWEDQFFLFKSLINHVSNLTFTISNSRVLVANVIADFIIQNANNNISTWSFGELYASPYDHLYTTYLEYDYFVEEIEMKIKLVNHLFNEISGVRQMAIHIGIIFLHGTTLSQDKIRTVSSIVQQQNTDVKIFVVIIGDRHQEEIIHLTDSIVLPLTKLQTFDQILLMAMCKMCLPGWFMFEHKVSTHFLSCYKLDSHELMDWTSAMAMCNKDYNGFLAGIETLAEMVFLQTYLYRLIKEKGNTTDVCTNNTMVYIGLHRDLSNYAKRFQWLRKPGLYYPLVIHHWLPGEPSEGFTSADCGMWVFYNIWDDEHNDNVTLHNSSSDYNYFEGWADIKCGSRLTSLSLCELVLPQKVQNIDVVTIKPTTIDVLETALGKGDFLAFQGNIVSVSENVANNEFLQFLRTTKRDFPIFDCGEDAFEPRYISYSMVCDFVGHCSNFRDETSCMNPRNIFSTNDLYCLSGQSLQRIENFCDNIKDCQDGSDERDCIYFSCESIRCCDGSCLPLQWVNDGEVDCFICDDNSSSSVTDESYLSKTHSQNNTSCALICNYGTCVDESQLNDGIKHCTGPEGPLDETIGNLEPANTCNNTHGHVIWAPKCVYIKDIYGGITGCRDMSHLTHCANSTCSGGYVKCQDSYCIPQHYLLDGKADCPTGEDEQSIYIGPCTDNFACWGNQVCLHPDLVCDGHPDCPNKDDELDCQKLCPEGFLCTGGTVTVSDYNKSVPLDMHNFSVVGPRIKYLDLSGIDLSEEKHLTVLINEIFFNVKVLILSNCKICSLYIPEYSLFMDYYTPFMTQKLDISYNMIQDVFEDTFSPFLFQNIRYLNASYNKHLVSLTILRFKFLELIDLSHTGLSYLRNRTFSALPSLKHLNLSYTMISDFSRHYFNAEFTLQTLDLRGITSEEYHANFFHDLRVTHHLYTDYFQLCCPQIRGSIIPPHVCHAPADAISSCFDLLGISIQRILLWMVAFLAVVGNMAVIVYRVIWDRSVLRTGYGLFVTNLGISDFIMGVYLFIIAGTDYFYRDKYVLYDKNWRQSIVCTCAGFMATLSNEISILFIFLITMDRYLVMKFPFGQKRFSRIYKIVLVTLSWCLGFVISLIPIVFNFDIYSSNAMCIGLPLTNTHDTGWGYSVGVFIIHNFIMLILIAYGQYAIFRAMSENSVSFTVISASNSRRAKDIMVAKQLSLVALSSFVCWFPVGLMGLLSLGGHAVSKEVYAWTTVLLLPINSAVNPVLYTIPAIITRWEKFKYGG